MSDKSADLWDYLEASHILHERFMLLVGKQPWWAKIGIPPLFFRWKRRIDILDDAANYCLNEMYRIKSE